MTVSKLKNYDNRIYLKDDLQNILNTSELKYVNSSSVVLLFPDNISLKRAKESLKTIDALLDDSIKKEKENAKSC